VHNSSQNWEAFLPALVVAFNFSDVINASFIFMDVMGVNNKQLADD
jgi:hypothetical protein